MRISHQGRRPFRLWQIDSEDVTLRSGWTCDVRTVGSTLWWTLRTHLGTLRYHRKARKRGWRGGVA